jgi:photosystem II stability/assembly factor-like uncharacterized protein
MKKGNSLQQIMKDIDFKGILFLLLVGLSFFIGDLTKNPLNPGLPNSSLSESGEEGNPASRLEFDWLRLKSPHSNTIPIGIERRALEFSKTIPIRRNFSGGLKRSKGFGTSLEWNSRGPYNVGGRTRALAIDVSDSNTFIAGGVSGGIWRSNDSGETWEKMTKSDQLHSVTSIAQDYREGFTNIWYAGTGEGRGNSAGGRGAPFRGDGIYKSTDNGYTWALLPSTSTKMPEIFEYLDYSWRIKVHPISGHIFSASYGTIYQSKDEGNSWKSILGNGNNSHSDLAITDKGMMIAVVGGETEGIIYSSTDGNSWDNITPPSFPIDYVRLVPDIAQSNDSIVYVIGNRSNDEHLLWKYKYSSQDSVHKHWTDLSANLPNDYNSQNGYDIYVRISPGDENFIFIGGTNLYYSTDGFKTSGKVFQLGGYGHDDHHADQHDVLFYKDKKYKVFSASDGGLHIMEDLTAFGKSWTSLNNGYTTTQFYTIAIDPKGSYPDLIMGGMQDNGTWESLKLNSKNLWSEVFGGDGAYCSIINYGKSYILSSQRGYTLIKDWNNPFNWSYGNGEGKYNNYSWAYLIPPDFNRDDDALFINPIYSSPTNDHILFYAGGKYIYRNNDVYLDETNYQQPAGGGGYESTKWEKLNGTSAIGDISAFGGSISPPNRLYYGTSSGYLYRLDNSEKNDKAIQIKNNIEGRGYVSSISVDPYNGNKLMVSFSSYEVKSIFYSDDGGGSWTDVSGNLEEMESGYGSGPSVRAIYIYPLKNGYRYFAGTSTGLYSTSVIDGTKTQWVLEGAETIGNVVVDMISGRPVDGYIAIGTHGNGTYSANFETNELSLGKSSIADQFELTQPYPNPFNPATIIQYSIYNEQNILLQVFNISGQLVETLVNGTANAGQHSILWSSGQISTGIYFIKMSTDLHCQTQKVLYLK